MAWWVGHSSRLLKGISVRLVLAPWRSLSELGAGCGSLCAVYILGANATGPAPPLPPDDEGI